MFEKFLTYFLSYSNNFDYYYLEAKIFNIIATTICKDFSSSTFVKILAHLIDSIIMKKKLKVLLTSAPTIYMEAFDKNINQIKGYVLYPPISLTTLAGSVLKKIKKAN